MSLHCSDGTHRRTSRAGHPLAFALALTALTALTALLASPRVASAQATLVTGLGGPADFGTNVLATGDDNSSTAIPLAPYDLAGLCFFGRTHTQMFINNNGNITFDAAVGGYTPTPFPASTNPMIAPWWADVDTRGAGAMIPPENRVYWDIRVGQLVVTWYRVGYYANHIDRRNTFQLIIRRVAGSMDYDIEFRYAQLTWTTGDASGGMMGVGGTPAQAGFDAGDRMNFTQLPGSRTAAVLNLLTTSNTTPPQPGVWLFRFRSCALSCVTNADCGGATPICDGMTRRCRACAAAADCSAPTPACATSGTNIGRCVQCTAPANCTAPFVCNLTSNLCVGCNSNADCSGSTPICDTVTRSCRRCDPARATDCTGATPVCGPAGRCVECAPGLTARCVAPTPFCDVMAFRCVSCRSNADCSGGTPYCAPMGCAAGAVAITSPMAGATASGRRPTITGTATPGQTVTVMVGGMTLMTTADPVTGMWSVTPAADLPVGDATATATIPPAGGMTPSATVMFVVPCASAADCTGATSPVCDMTSRRCRGCMANSDCPMTAPVCAPTGACVLCTMGMSGMPGACATSTDGRACLETMPGGPLFCGCTTDADCGAADSGRVCDGTMRRCIDGCSVAPMRNGCPMGQFCSSADPMVLGRCTTSCNFDTDCMRSMPMRPRCMMPGAGDAGADGGAMMNTCVECVTDAHCAARTDGRDRCIGAGNTCAQCTATDRAMCTAAGPGSACLTSGLCGCTGDSDCSSDRMCDMAMSRCVSRTMTDAGPDGATDGGTDASSSDAGEDVATADASDAASTPDAMDGTSNTDGSTGRDVGAEGGRFSGTGACACRVVGAGSASDTRSGRAALALLALASAVVIARRRARPRA